MSTRLARLLRIFIPTVLVVGAAIGAGVATGAIPDSSGVIHGCRNTKYGQLRVIDTQRGGTCRRGETPLDWNQQGPKGDTGLAGAPGAQGPPATKYFAWVDEKGILQRGSAGAIAAKDARFAGVYTVTFPGTNLDGCVPIASPGQASNNGFAANTQIDPRVGSWPSDGNNPSVIEVFTTNGSTGDPKDAPFQVAVFC